MQLSEHEMIRLEREGFSNITQVAEEDAIFVQAMFDDQAWQGRLYFGETTSDIFWQQPGDTG